MLLKRNVPNLLGIIAFFLLTTVFSVAALDLITRENTTGRPDIIPIEIVDPNIPNQMPPAIFYHDLHTEALEGKSCNTCHIKYEGTETYNFAFKGIAKKDETSAADIFHESCIGCHENMESEGEHAGPKTGNCRGCHNKNHENIFRKKLPFDRSLHYRHVSQKAISPTVTGQTDNCSACHHEYDEIMKKTVYKEGKEGACRYCHLEKNGEVARAIQTVTHESCLNCHKKMQVEKAEKTGPATCEGCHTLEFQKNIKKVTDIPRIKRNQPDTVLMATTVNQMISAGEDIKMAITPVAFNHKIHEEKTETCQACHHASLEKCATCHTVTGDKKGDYVPLESAMHTLSETKTCAGCHETAKEKKACAGCHMQMVSGRIGENTCKDCHSQQISYGETFPVEKEGQAKLAGRLIADRTPSPITFQDTEVPEKISIGIMKKDYEPAEFPHRKIVNQLLSEINKETMGMYFHREKYAMCKGCHHNSSMKSGVPAKCASCHTLSSGPAKDERPNLKGAYHGQCIGCHDQMGMEKPKATDCAACHKEKPLS